MTKLTEEEEKFIERAKPLLRKFLQMCEEKGIEPGAGSYVLSEMDNIYHGVPFAVAREIQGEENAIGTMVTEEGIKSKLKSVLIVGSPEEPILPCGMCKAAIERYDIKDASIHCADLHLSKIKKFAIPELHPEPYQNW